MAVTAERAPGQAAGSFAVQPRGVILHGSRGGADDVMTEYRGTKAWAVGNPAGLCWNATIGPSVYCVHLPARQWGWNAREHSQDFLAVEFAQPTIASPIPDSMVAAFVAWFRAEVAPAWPGLTPRVLLLPMHSELPAGKRDGKTDAFRADSAGAKHLRARIYAGLEAGMASDDARMEAYYQANKARLGQKKYAAMLDRAYGGQQVATKVLVCERGVVTPDGETLEAFIVDDWATVNERAGTLTRLGQST
jgi:hypothetical protein